MRTGTVPCPERTIRGINRGDGSLIEDIGRFLALNVAQSFRLNSGGTSTKRCAIVSTQF